MRILRADITTLDVEAIVNAANSRMLGGGGVDGAIHRAAGPELYIACVNTPEVAPNVRCPVGEARITPGFKLKAKHVIHTVGPIYRGPESAPMLASAYRSSLAIANEHGIETIAFPAISCGVYEYPVREAAKIAVETCRAHIGAIREITFALFGEEAYDAWNSAL
ncbi:MAG: O-acetyl-ADP-ribose deacetylase [Planctomycetota bacterium]|jgi:O-acetyl-ADP-ribose deacetylase (regulator of RNase III)